jgi:hypothetical protein
MINVGTLSTLFLSLFISNAPVETNSINAENAITARVVIDDFSDEANTYNWWDSSSDKWTRKWDREKEILVITCKNVGKSFDTFGKQFEPVDFSVNPALKVRMKYEGETAPKVRIDLKDYDGKVANAKPIMKTLSAGDFKDYYYNYTGRFNQTWPDADEVDAVEIVEMLIFINPGGTNFSGTLYLDKIEAIPASECKE